MSCLKIALRGTGEKDLRELQEILKKEVAAELVAETWREMDRAQILMLTFEKYYFRTGNYAGLTIMLTQESGWQTADIVGFGGGDGMFNISFGANRDFAEMAEEILKRNGFQEE